MPRIRCLGCNRLFSQRALELHLAQSTNPRCRSIYEENDNYLPGGYEVLDPGTDLDAGDLMENKDAEEDYTGPWPDSNDSDSSESHCGSNLNQPEIYSPVPDEADNVQGATPAAAALNDLPAAEEDEGMRMDVDENGQRLTANQRRLMSTCQWGERWYYEFPGLRAGETLRISASRGYMDYSHELGSDSGDNPYFPFASKTDWDFAKWAKLRGPSSTATTELLDIDGVRNA